MLATFGAAAEFERELISERVGDGMVRARKENKKIGRSVILQHKSIDVSRLVDLRIGEINQGYLSIGGEQEINSPWDPEIGVRKAYPLKSVDLFIYHLSMFLLRNKELFVGLLDAGREERFDDV
ncbi:MAG: hypothetical protein ACYCR2_05820 [Thermoplasmataceae archaeon]